MKLSSIEFLLPLNSINKRRKEPKFPFLFQFRINDEITNETIWGGNDFHVDPNVLFSSFCSGSSGFLLTCKCGNPACANIQNEFSIIDQTRIIVWMIPKTPNNEDKDEPCGYDVYYFDKREYKQKLYELASNILKHFCVYTFNWYRDYTYDMALLKCNLDALMYKYEKDKEREERRLANKREFELKRKQSEVQ